MKKNLHVVQLLIFSLVVMFVTSLRLNAQQWVVYDGSVSPDAVFDWDGGSGTLTDAIIDDPNISDNKLYKWEVAGGTGNWRASWSADIGGITFVTRVRGDLGPDFHVMSITTRNGEVRPDIRIEYTKLNPGGTKINADYAADFSKWHIVRITLANDSSMFVYLDEDPTPVLTDTATTSSGNRYLQWGDPSGGDNYGGLVDWVLFDTSGVYAPGEGAAIPDSLSTNSAALVGYFNNDDRTMTSTAVAFDNDPVIQMLKADPNFEVDVKIVATDSVVDLSPYDIVIVQEGFSSSAKIFQPGGTLALENIAVPFIYNKAYALRDGKAVTSATATAGQTPAKQLHIVVETGKETHPLFSGITMTSDSIKMFKAPADDYGSDGEKTMNYASDLEMTDATTLLAKLKGATGNISVCFNDIPAGTVLGTEDTLKARMIAIGENYGAISKDLGRNLTDENITIWRNAVYLLAGLEVPTTLVEAPARIEIGYFNNDDRTMTATAAPFDADPVIQMLKADLNFNVDVKIVATDSVVDLSPYDVVVVQEGFTSSAKIFQPGGTLALENITVPFIYNKAYALRDGKAVTSATAAAGQTPGKQLHIVVEEGKATHKIFSGITMADSIKMFKTPADDYGSDGEKTMNFAYNLEMSDTTTLLAKLKGAEGKIAVCFNDIPAGTVVGTEDTLKARMIAISENYGAIARDMGANLTDENLTIWRNAIYLLAGLDVPATPLVAAKSANAYLSGISLSSGTLVPAFNKDSVEYTVELSAGTTSVDVTATTAHPLANVDITNDGTIDVSTGSGTATILVTAENGSATMTYTVDFTVLPEGIEEASASTIRVYPTVSNRWFNVETQEAGMIRVYDISGRMISSQEMIGNVARIEISEAGIYLLDIRTDSQRKVVRVVRTQ
jgi:hypothetical protein